jgi:hypothetical protein
MTAINKSSAPGTSGSPKVPKAPGTSSAPRTGYLGLAGAQILPLAGGCIRTDAQSFGRVPLRPAPDGLGSACLRARHQGAREIFALNQRSALGSVPHELPETLSTSAHPGTFPARTPRSQGGEAPYLPERFCTSARTDEILWAGYLPSFGLELAELWQSTPRIRVSRGRLEPAAMACMSMSLQRISSRPGSSQETMSCWKSVGIPSRTGLLKARVEFSRTRSSRPISSAVRRASPTPSAQCRLTKSWCNSCASSTSWPSRLGRRSWVVRTWLSLGCVSMASTQRRRLPACACTSCLATTFGRSALAMGCAPCSSSGPRSRTRTFTSSGSSSAITTSTTGSTDDPGALATSYLPESLGTSTRSAQASTRFGAPCTPYLCHHRRRSAGSEISTIHLSARHAELGNESQRQYLRSEPSLANCEITGSDRWGSPNNHPSNCTTGRRRPWSLRPQALSERSESSHKGTGAVKSLERADASGLQNHPRKSPSEIWSPEHQEINPEGVETSQKPNPAGDQRPTTTNRRARS